MESISDFFLLFLLFKISSGISFYFIYFFFFKNAISCVVSMVCAFRSLFLLFNSLFLFQWEQSVHWYVVTFIQFIYRIYLILTLVRAHTICLIGPVSVVIITEPTRKMFFFLLFQLTRRESNSTEGKKTHADEKNEKERKKYDERNRSPKHYTQIHGKSLNLHHSLDFFIIFSFTSLLSFSVGFFISYSFSVVVVAVVVVSAFF